MTSETEKTLADLYFILKNRDKSNPNSLHEVASLYEDFREALAWCSPEVYNQVSVISGRALSNVCYDIMALPSTQKLNLTSKDSFSSSCIFFLGHRGGLCNRLRAIASLSFISKRIGCDFGFSWYETVACRGGVLPSKKFSNKISPVIKALDMSLGNIIFEDNPATPWYFFEIFKNHGFIKSWDDFNKGYIKESKILLDAILYNAGLSKYIEDFIEENSLKNYVALHIRRTDFVPYFAERYPSERLPETIEYVNYVKSKCLGRKVFLSTDDIDVKELFVSEFGRDVCVLDFEFDKKQLRQTSFNHSLLDLALLSRSEKLVVTPRSSFSEYASSISNSEIIKLWEL